MIIKLPTGVVLRTIKISDLRKRLDKQLTKLTEKVNANPSLLEFDWELRDDLKNYMVVMDTFKKLESKGVNKLWAVYSIKSGANPNQTFWSHRVDANLPLGVLRAASDFEQTHVYELYDQPPNLSKRVPRYFLNVCNLRYIYSLSEYSTTNLFYAPPTNIKVAIEFIPVFENNKVIFVKRDKADKVTPQNTSPSPVTA